MFGFPVGTGAGIAQLGSVAEPGALQEALTAALAPFGWIGLAFVLIAVLALVLDRDRPARERSRDDDDDRTLRQRLTVIRDPDGVVVGLASAVGHTPR